MRTFSAMIENNLYSAVLDIFQFAVFKLRLMRLLIFCSKKVLYEFIVSKTIGCIYDIKQPPD